MLSGRRLIIDGCADGHANACRSTIRKISKRSTGMYLQSQIGNLYCRIYYLELALVKVDLSGEESIRDILGKRKELLIFLRLFPMRTEEFAIGNRVVRDSG